MNPRGRPLKSIGTTYDNRKNVRLSDMYVEMLQEIAAYQGVPGETLLRKFALEGIRREHQYMQTNTASQSVPVI